MNFNSNEDKYIISRWMYSIGEPVIEDAEYTILHSLMLSKNSLPEYVARSWSSDPCPKALLESYGLAKYAIDIMNTDRTDSIPSLNSEYEVKREYEEMTTRHFVSPKYDGFSAVVYYYNKHWLGARSRGRATDAIDFSRLKHVVPEVINAEGLVCVIGEAVLSEESFQKLKLLYPERNLKSARNSVRTALSTDDGCKLLEFKAFDVKDMANLEDIIPFLKANGFNVPEFKEVNDYEELMFAMKSFDMERDKMKDTTDGLVVRVAVGTYKRAVRIWSWQEPIISSFVMGFREEYQRHEIPLQIKIYPVKREGATQRRVNITNLSRVLLYGLAVPYAPVCFKVVSASNADIDVEATLMLQEEYEGRYEEFAEYIKEREYVNAVG